MGSHTPLLFRSRLLIARVAAVPVISELLAAWWRRWKSDKLRSTRTKPSRSSCKPLTTRSGQTTITCRVHAHRISCMNTKSYSRQTPGVRAHDDCFRRYRWNFEQVNGVSRMHVRNFSSDDEIAINVNNFVGAAAYAQPSAKPRVSSKIRFLGRHWKGSPIPPACGNGWQDHHDDLAQYIGKDIAQSVGPTKSHRHWQRHSATTTSLCTIFLFSLYYRPITAWSTLLLSSMCPVHGFLFSSIQRKVFLAAHRAQAKRSVGRDRRLVQKKEEHSGLCAQVPQMICTCGRQRDLAPFAPMYVQLCTKAATRVACVIRHIGCSISATEGHAPRTSARTAVRFHEFLALPFPGVPRHPGVFLVPSTSQCHLAHLVV